MEQADKTLDGAVAVVTGAAQGLGLGIAAAWAVSLRRGEG